MWDWTDNPEYILALFIIAAGLWVSMPQSHPHVETTSGQVNVTQTQGSEFGEMDSVPDIVVNASEEVEQLAVRRSHLGRDDVEVDRHAFLGPNRTYEVETPWISEENITVIALGEGRTELGYAEITTRREGGVRIVLGAVGLLLGIGVAGLGYWIRLRGGRA